MANLQQRITDWWAPLKAALRPGQVAPMPGRNSSGSYANWYQMVRAWAAQFQPISPNEAREGYDNSIVDICLNWICTSWQVATPQVGADTPDGFMPLEGGHWLLDLLATPAPDMDGGTLSWAMLSDFLRRGNAYAQIVKTRGGQVASLVYLPAKYIKVVPGSDGRLSHFEYSPNGEQYRMLPDEVLHVRHGIDEENPLQGRSPLAAQYREIVTDNAYSDWAAGLAKNGGIPPVLFTPRAAGDGTVAMTAAEAKTISDQLNEKFRSEPGRARIIPGALEMHKTGLVPNEMALTDVRAMPETRIPAALGLPALLLQLYTGIQKSTFNNFDTAVRLGWEGCLIPLMRVFAGAITRQVLYLDPAAKQKKLRLQYDTSGVRELQTDMTAVREAARADKVAGIITVDEARAEQGLAPEPSLAAAAIEATSNDPAKATDTPGAASKSLPWQQGTVTKREAQSGDIYAAADAFRRRLARNESDALDYLAAEWERATASTRKRLDDILRRLAEAEAAGEPIEARLTLLADRLADLLPQMEDKLAALAERGAAIVENAQRQAMNTTEQSAYDMAKAQGIGTWNRVPSESFEALAGFASDGTPLHDLLSDAFGEYADAVRSGLLTTIAQGGGPKQAAAQIVALTGTARSRAETIARTEMLRASREASRRTYQANRDVLSGWVRLSAADIRTCPACWALHGQQHPTDDIMPTHPNCFVAGTMVQSHKVLATMERWYDGDVLDITTESGAVITVTPNHPILTANGWVAADLLAKGSHVIRSLDSERVLSAVNPDYNNVPTAIEQVSKTLWGSGGVTTAAVEVSPEDFHGDGIGSQIGIIRTDGLLRGTLNASFKKPLPHDDLIARRVEASGFSRGGDFASVLESVLLASDGVVGSNNVSPVLFRCTNCGHESISLERSTNGDTSFYESPTDDDAVGFERFCDVLFGLTGHIAADDFSDGHIQSSGIQAATFPQRSIDAILSNADDAGALLHLLTGLVETDCILDISRRYFSGHVYNLQTATGWYIANSIISHNCRCVAVPVPADPALRSDIPDGESLFTALPESEQVEILGPGRFEQWRNGLPFTEFADVSSDPRWGPTVDTRRVGAPTAQEIPA